MKTSPKSQLIQKRQEKKIQLANSSVANLEKLRAATGNGSWKATKKKSSRPSALPAALVRISLGKLIEETRSRLAALTQEWEHIKEKTADLKNSAVAVQKEYDKIMSWADLYAGSNIVGKKIILRQLIDRVNIGWDFEVEVEFKISVTQFFHLMDNLQCLMAVIETVAIESQKSTLLCTKNKSYNGILVCRTILNRLHKAENQ